MANTYRHGYVWSMSRERGCVCAWVPARDRIISTTPPAKATAASDRGDRNSKRPSRQSVCGEFLSGRHGRLAVRSTAALIAKGLQFRVGGNLFSSSDRGGSTIRAIFTATVVVPAHARDLPPTSNGSPSLRTKPRWPTRRRSSCRFDGRAWATARARARARCTLMHRPCKGRIRRPPMSSIGRRPPWPAGMTLAWRTRRPWMMTLAAPSACWCAGTPCSAQTNTRFAPRASRCTSKSIGRARWTVAP